MPLLKKMYIKACLFDLNEPSKTFFEKLDTNNHNCTKYTQECVHCQFEKIMKAKKEFDKK